MQQTMTDTEAVRRGYQAFNEGDVETISGLLADDVTWTTPGESTVAGTARGRDAVLAQFGRQLLRAGYRDEAAIALDRLRPHVTDLPVDGRFLSIVAATGELAAAFDDPETMIRVNDLVADFECHESPC